MKFLSIARIVIDDHGRLLVFPERPDANFDLVYRAGCEVTWDPAGYFYSPPPREWSYSRWAEQILFAVRGEFRVILVATERTIYTAIPDSDASAIRLALARPA